MLPAGDGAACYARPVPIEGSWPGGLRTADLMPLASPSICGFLRRCGRQFARFAMVLASRRRFESGVFQGSATLDSSNRTTGRKPSGTTKLTKFPLRLLPTFPNRLISPMFFLFPGIISPTLPCRRNRCPERRWISVGVGRASQGFGGIAPAQACAANFARSCRSPGRWSARNGRSVVAHLPFPRRCLTPPVVRQRRAERRA